MSTESNPVNEPNTGVLPPRPITAKTPLRPPVTGKADFRSPAHLAAAAAPLPMKITVEVSPELDAIIDNMAEAFEETKGTTILRALALLRTALEAKNQGERLMIVNDDENTERELAF